MLIRWFESMFKTAERFIKAKPLLATIAGGILA